MLNRTNIVLAGLFVGVVALTAATHVDYSRTNIEILPDMKYTPAWTSYEQNSVFANGRTLQAPVPGTIARGQMPIHFEPTKEDASRAGVELQNPYQNSTTEAAGTLQESFARGGGVYRVFCVSCHGATGNGDGPVPQRGFPPPPSLLTGKSLQMKDGQLFHILTVGQGSMSGFAGQISPELHWDVINYVRSMQSQSSRPVGAETSNTGDDSPTNQAVATESDPNQHANEDQFATP